MVFHSLDLDVRYVLAVRNPLSVARSRAKLNPQRGTQEKSDLEWLVNVVPYFREVREAIRSGGLRSGYDRSGDAT